MTPQRCIASSKGEFGDCFRACLATILDLPAADVPNFGHLCGFDDAGMHRLAREWLALRGMGLFNTWVNGEWPLEKLLTNFSADNPGVPFILHGRAAAEGVVPGEINHAVVALDGAIVHDPSGAGISGPAVASAEGEPNWWWIDVVAVADLARVSSQN